MAGKQNFVPPLALIGQAVSEKMFEHCEQRTEDKEGNGSYYKLTYEPLAQVS